MVLSKLCLGADPPHEAVADARRIAFRRRHCRLGVEHHTIARLDELEFVTDRSIKQAVATQAPCALILSPLLTGGKTFAS